MTTEANPFDSFWMGGFEGADHINGERRALDIASECGHVAQLEDDHRRAAELGIRTVRESIGWRLAEPEPGRYDLARATRIARSARAHGLQVVWSLMHYGTPADVSLLDDRMIGRFGRFAAAVADRLAPWSDRPPVYNPINEISFVSWAVSQTNLMYPYRSDAAAGGEPDPDEGYDVKKRLIRATLEAIEAMRRVDPRARFLHVDPLVHVAAPYARPDFADLALEVTNYQWQTWDMVAGRLEPQLGGHAEALDLIGVNHYHSSQWEMPGGARLSWYLRDPRRQPFAALLRECWERYRRPLIVAETSHFGDGRAAWLDQMAGEVRDCRAAGVPVQGICLYPLIDRPDWTRDAFWHHSGLWDVAGARQEQLPDEAPEIDPDTLVQRRVLNLDYAEALKRWQRALPEPLDGDAAKPWLIVFSHLRWEGLWHRPQQLATRLAARFRVLFVEEPITIDPAVVPYLDRIRQRPGIEVVVPRLHGPPDGFDASARHRIAPLLARYLREQAIEQPLVWCCTPLAWPLATGIAARARIYDCSDELAGFAGASAELAELEPQVLRQADLVLCAGPALAAARAATRADVHCIANGVDAAWFRAERDPHDHEARAAALLHRSIPGPRLGYAGAIDERLDLPLIDALAAARPDWQIVMVGPVCKIDPAALPQRPNLHWRPWQPHARLPHLFAGWQVALLPFVISAATRAANPTKLLEYLAAGKPVVATALPDVVALHADRIAIAHDAVGFIAACAAALEGRGPIDAGVPLRSWEQCADEVLALIDRLD